MTLLTAKDVERFLSAYTQALDSRLGQHRSKTTTDLLELDSWRLWTLRDAIRSRNPSFMTKPELEKLMDCKLSRGSFRPRLKQLIMALGNEEVLSTTEQAFAELGEGALGDVKTAVTTLKKMKGVGPATATMVLQAKRDEVPFMSDEAMMLVFNCEKVKLKYDLKTCMAYIEKINEIVTELKNEYSASEIERALFTKYILESQTQKKEISPPPTKSRKRAAQEEVAEQKRGKKKVAKDTNRKDVKRKRVRK